MLGERHFAGLSTSFAIPALSKVPAKNAAPAVRTKAPVQAANEARVPVAVAKVGEPAAKPPAAKAPAAKAPPKAPAASAQEAKAPVASAPAAKAVQAGRAGHRGCLCTFTPMSMSKSPVCAAWCISD